MGCCWLACAQMTYARALLYEAGRGPSLSHIRVDDTRLTSSSHPIRCPHPKTLPSRRPRLPLSIQASPTAIPLAWTIRTTRARVLLTASRRKLFLLARTPALSTTAAIPTPLLRLTPSATNCAHFGRAYVIASPSCTTSFPSRLARKSSSTMASRETRSTFRSLYSFTVSR